MNSNMMFLITMDGLNILKINLEKEGPDSKYAGIKKVSVHEIITNCVEDIWDDFDDDGNGYLDK